MSYLRLDIKGPESMPDGMGCHLPMKLRRQNSHSLFTITVASVSSSSDSKTLLLLPWLPKILQNICEQTIGTQAFLAACRGLSQVTGRGRTPHQAKRKEVRHSLRRCSHWSFHRWFEPFHLRISHVILRDVFYGFPGGVALMIVHILFFGLGKHGHRLWPLLLCLSHFLEELPSCMQLTCFIEQRAPHLIRASQVLPSELEPSVELHCVHSCLDESDKIGSLRPSPCVKGS